MAIQIVTPDMKPQETSRDEVLLPVSEFFLDTIQGEGIFMGHPASFLRVQGCPVNCAWCDSAEVWKNGGGKFPINFLIDEMKKHPEVLHKMRNNRQHLVLTGGSPMLYQKQLLHFLHAFEREIGFQPYIEIENECSIQIKEPGLALRIQCWNNSPKLANSGVSYKVRYKPEVIDVVAREPNSWFKFVVNSEEDIQEIKDDYINAGLISWAQVILMPMGADREELSQSREFVVNKAIELGVRYSDRLHIVLWDKKTGV